MDSNASGHAQDEGDGTPASCKRVDVIVERSEALSPSNQLAASIFLPHFLPLGSLCLTAGFQMPKGDLRGLGCSELFIGRVK